MEDNINVFFSGSPPGGFTAYPIEYESRTAPSDSNSFGNEEVHSSIRVSNKKTTICYIVYGIGSNSEDKREGRSFGIWIDILGYMPSTDQYDAIYGSLEEFFMRGIVNNNQVNLLSIKDGKIVYDITSFRENGNLFDKLIKLFKKIFKEDFGDTLVPIKTRNSKAEIIILPTSKSTSNKEKSTSTKKERPLSNKQHNEINQLKNKILKLETDLNAKREHDQKNNNYFSLFFLANFLIGATALILVIISSKWNSNETNNSLEIIKETQKNEQVKNEFQGNVLNFNSDKNLAYVDQKEFLSYLEKGNENISNIDQFVDIMSLYLIDKSKEINIKYDGNPSQLKKDLIANNKSDITELKGILKTVSTNSENNSGILAKKLSEKNTLEDFIVYRSE